MAEPILLDTSTSDFEQSNAMWETIHAVCEELGLDARNSLCREIVAHEVIECARWSAIPNAFVRWWSPTSRGHRD